MKHALIILALFISFSAIAQNRSNWTVLDFLNAKTEDPFITEKNITGLCFIILAEDFDYYKDSIIILGNNNNSEVLKITYTESGQVQTSYKGHIYKQGDETNPFKPWLFWNNPDYFRLAFECVDSVGSYYKVKLSHTDFAIIRKKDKTFEKETIFNFIFQWTQNGFDFNRITNPVKELPQENSKTIFSKEKPEYKIWRGDCLEIKGDWIKVKTVKDEVGWVRWRSGTKVLIRMYYSC